jgi:putative restriction endonuclease
MKSASQPSTLGMPIGNDEAHNAKDPSRRNILSDLTETLSKIEGDQAIALDWFHRHKGSTVSWAAMQAYSETTSRLVNQAKGIYKPHYTEYALSVRQTLTSPYADKEIIRRADGSWVYPYFQENANPAERDKAVTNRGLMKCMKDRVPVGVLLQVKPKPAVEYLVLGLALVTEWKDGYFFLEGFSDQGTLRATEVGADAAHDRTRAEVAAVVIQDFDANDVDDRREKQIAEVIRRKGQAKFRAKLLEAYNRKCAITGCDAVEALEAAHIIPYQGSQTDHPQNGILLRADIHSLFDLGLITVDPDKMTVVLAAGLCITSYGELNGRSIYQPMNVSLLPSSEALAQHRKWAGL